MTDELGRGSYRIDVDKTKAEASIKGFETSAKKSGDAVEKAVGKQATGAFGKLDASIKKITQGGGITGAILGGVGIGAGLGVFSAVSTGIGMVTDFMGDAIDAASDLAESQSKVNVVFGKSADAITDWSKDAATAMGLSQQAALEAAGTLGNLFSALGLAEDATVDMSKGIVKLAADLGSFNNVSTDEALLALRSGLLGEAEPMRKFGSNLSAARVEAYALAKGLARTRAEITDAIKVQARYGLILEDTTLAQGDFDRTSDGLANTTKTLNAQIDDMTAAIGQELLPYIAQLAKVARDDLVPALQAVIGSIGGVLTLTDIIAKASRGDLAGIVQMANEFATSSFVGWLKEATDQTDELITAWQGLANEMGTMPDSRTIPWLESLTEAQRTALLAAENLPSDLRDALTAGAPAVGAGAAVIAGEMVKPVEKALAPLPDYVTAVFKKVGKKIKIELRSGLEEARDVAKLGAAAIRWGLNHPGGDKTLGEALADDIAKSEKRRRRALREGNTTALKIIDDHLADVRARQAALNATVWRYNIEIAQSRLSNVPVLGGLFPQHATGLARVPYDGYVARLHRDERVLTAREASTYNQGGGANGRVDFYVHDEDGGLARAGISTGALAAELGSVFAEANRTATTRYTMPRRAGG